jgi:hypothetical protein
MATKSSARFKQSVRREIDVDSMKTKAERITEKIRRQTEDRIAYYASAGKEAIDGRLEELENEWDVERCIVLNASGVSLLSIILGAARSRRWYLASFVASALLLQHSVQGNPPLMELFRNLGIRTQGEIDFERFSLKFLRGDFKELQVLDPYEDAHYAEAHEAFEAAMS